MGDGTVQQNKFVQLLKKDTIYYDHNRIANLKFAIFKNKKIEFPSKPTLTWLPKITKVDLHESLLKGLSMATMVNVHNLVRDMNNDNYYRKKMVETYESRLKGVKNALKKTRLIYQSMVIECTLTGNKHIKIMKALFNCTNHYFVVISIFFNESRHLVFSHSLFNCLCPNSESTTFTIISTLVIILLCTT